MPAPCAGDSMNLGQLLAGVLSGTEAETLRAHVADCPSCQLALDKLTDQPELRPWLAAFNPNGYSPVPDCASSSLMLKLCLPSAPETARGGPQRLAGPQADVKLGLVGPFRLLALLGRGGMGVVYKAYDPELCRVVAIKVLPADRLDEPARARFLREARAAAGIQHEHVVPVYAVVCPSEGTPYLVMQYIEGQTLRELIRSANGLAPREAARLVREAAQGLTAAHGVGLIHRDVKPSNILVEAGSGKAKVLDFGLARNQDGSEGVTQAGILSGTPEYMSPEQIRAPDSLDSRADVYGLGTTLYETLTGAPPFRGAAHMVLQQALHDEPIPPRRLNDRIPRDLETICLKAMAKERSRRYATAEELADDLGRWLAGESIRARPVGSVERAWRWCRRKPALASLLTAVPTLLLVITVGASLSAWWLSEERDNVQTEKNNVETERLAAVQNLREAYLAQAQGQRYGGQPGRRFKSLEVLKKAAAIHPGLDLRNEAIACLALADIQPARSWKPRTLHINGVPRIAFDENLDRYVESDPHGNLTIRRVADDAELCQLSGWGLQGAVLLFSPDGRFLAVRYSANKAFRVWDLQSRQAVLNIPMPTGPVGYYAQQFFGDSGRIAIGLADRSLRFYELPSGKETHRLPLVAAMDAIALHPDGEKMAVSLWNLPGVDLLSVATGKLLQRVAVPATASGLAWHPHGKLLAVACKDTPPRCLVWNTETAKRHAVLEGHKNQVTDCVFNHAGDLLATTGWGETTCLWDPGSGKQLVSIAGTAHKFSKDDRHLAYVKFNKSAEFGFWQVSAGRECRNFHAFSEESDGPWSVDIHPAGRLMASASEDCARMWDLATGQELARLPVGNSRTALFLPSGDIVTFGELGLQRWPMKEDAAGNSVRVGPPKLLARTETPAQYSNARLSRDGRWLAAIAGPRQSVVFELEQPASRVVCDGHDNLGHLSLSPDGHWLATATQHGSGIKVWDARTGKCVTEIPAGNNGATEFSYDSRRLVTWSNGHSPRAWDVGSWQPQVLSDQRWEQAAYDLNGRMMAVRTDSGVVLKDTATGEELATLTPAHLLPMSRFSFSPDGSQLAVGCHNYHTIQVWDLRAIRQRLQSMNLDWDLPAFSPPISLQSRPLTVQVVTTEK